LKLLLDEMVSAVIAAQLRAHGHDVEAVSERSVLRGMTDDELFEYTQAAHRCLVTYNGDDFLELDRRRRSQHQTHEGVVILNPKRFPQGAASVGALVTSLDRLLAGGSPYESFIHWLQ
jgi:predicted nuclease of predicted toxin-antitoxin system